MSEHTPGPWAVGRAEFTDKGVMYEIIMPAQRIIAFDASLIAAAPDLKEALEECAELLETILKNEEANLGSYVSTIEQARAALAKAEPPRCANTGAETSSCGEQKQTTN